MYYSWHTLKLGSIHIPDAGLMPFLCGFALTVLGIVWMTALRLAEEPENKNSAEKRLWHRPLLSLLLMLVYAWTMEAIGYFTSTIFFMVLWQKVIEHERWGKTLIISFIGTAIMYTIFIYFLNVPVPQEIFLR